MKTASIILYLLVGYADAFVPNPQTQQTYQNLNRIPGSRFISTISKSASNHPDSLQSAVTDEETTPARTILSNFLSPISLNKNETSSAPLVAITQLPEPLSEPLSTPPSLSEQNSILPDWLVPIAWRAVIVVLCALWASNFAVAKLVMAEPGVDSSLYALSRFGVAVTSLAPFAIRSVVKAQDNEETDTEPMIDLETLKAAVLCGSWVAFGYLGQTVGLLTTTASKSCVICSMHCVFVALVAEVWRVQKASKEAVIHNNNDAAQFDVSQLIPAAVAVIGVAIVELTGSGGSPTIGDALSFSQPIGFGMGYLILENIMARKPEAALPVSAIKLTVVMVASFLMFEASPLLHGGTISDIIFKVPDFSPILQSPTALGGILYTGLVTTALALWVESTAFVNVPATDASLILTTEPLFAAGFGAVALGETFGTSDYIGASLIVGACALSIFLDGPTAEPASDS
jgi:drug/metabolite transporter (DMT)-like permease